MDSELFPLITKKRGLDPLEVESALKDTKSQVENLETQQAEIDRKISNLNREISEVKSALKRSSSKPSFSDLGAAFEQTLRVAEEQAAKLISDAQLTSSETRQSAENDAEELRTSSELQATKAIEDAESLVQRLHREAEKKFSGNLRIAKAAMENATSQVYAAQQAAEEIAEQGLIARKKIESDLIAEKNQAREQIATLRQIHERDHRRISDEISAAPARAERESERLTAENEEYISQLLQDSQQQLEIARERARASVIEEQNNFGKARQDGVKLIRDARETAAGILRRARAREQTLTERLEERTALLLKHGEDLVEEFSLERESVEAFNSELRIISLSEKADEGIELQDFSNALTEELVETTPVVLPTVPTDSEFLQFYDNGDQEKKQA